MASEDKTIEQKTPRSVEMPKPRNPMNEAAQIAEQRRQIEAEQQGDDEVVMSGGRQRVPFGAVRQRLHAEARPGFYRRWFNDVNNRIERAREAGYEIVVDERTGKPVQSQSGQSPNGGSLVQYLMEIPEEWRKADFEAQQKSLDEVEKVIYSGKHKAEADDMRYTPKGHQAMTASVVTGAARLR